MNRIPLAEYHARLKAQGVSAREHAAVKCCMCGTVQSITSVLRAGCPPDRIDTIIGFSCEGRFNNAGPWPNDPKKQKARAKRGCDWTLGGLLRLHTLEVDMGNGKTSPAFEPATPEAAQALEHLMTKEAPA